MRASTDEYWRIGLRQTANLIGFALYPVGWSWAEYPRRKFRKRMPYEEKAEEVGRLGIALREADTKAGFRAFRSGVKFRRANVERHLLRMIKREEIPVTIINHRMEGSPLDDRMRLDEALTFNVTTNGIGLFDLDPGSGYDFETDAEAVMNALEARRAWKTNSSVHDWLVVERHLRELFESLGIPSTRDEYASRTASWYTSDYVSGKEPSASKLRELTSALYEEYCFSDSEI